MQATITYCLTEAAQRAQMVATGQPVTRLQTVTASDLTPEQLALCSVDHDGGVSLDLTQQASKLRGGSADAVYALTGGSHSTYQMDSYHADGASVLAIVAAASKALAEKAKREKQEDIDRMATARANADAAMQRFLDSDAVPASEHAINWAGGIDISCRDRKEPLVQAYWAEARARLAKVEAAKAESQRRAEEAKEAREAAKTAYIAEWIGANAEPDTQAQFADGLLCRSAAVALIADAAFAAAGIGEEIADSVICSNTDCPCYDEVKACIPRRIYPAWRAIKAGLPKGSTAEFRKVRDCDPLGENGDSDDGAGPAYYAATITMPHGPFTFSRRVRLG